MAKPTGSDTLATSGCIRLPPGRVQWQLAKAEEEAATVRLTALPEHKQGPASTVCPQKATARQPGSVAPAASPEGSMWGTPLRAQVVSCLRHKRHRPTAAQADWLPPLLLCAPTATIDLRLGEPGTGPTSSCLTLITLLNG